nr:transglycosylase domain-containing protein [Treponema sp. OMZ 788]
MIFLILAGGAFALGKMLALTKNIKQSELFVDFNPALPSRILDIRGDLITEFSLDEKRELVNYGDISPNLIAALLAREDRLFYEHKGFRIKSILRAVIGQLTGRSLGGGSTITQQIAGLLYCDRTDKSVKRKIKELWWAIQMERRHSKDEIMMLYLNEAYFGGGTNGVSAASRFYFGHSAAELTPAEAAILIIQLSNPTRYNPFNYPNRAKERQENVLEGMVGLGFLSKKRGYGIF